jgi:PAS domain S-box-containing protein
LIHQKLAHVQDVIRVRREKGFAAASELVNRGDGGDVMQQIRALAAQMETQEGEWLEERQAEGQTNGQKLNRAIALVMFLTLGIAVVAGIIIRGDIAERKLAENALRESEARLREAEALAHLGSSMWDVDTDTTIWSEELYHITGRSLQESIPSHAARAGIYSPESWARLDAAAGRALATGEPYDLELEVVRPDGAVRWAHARGAAVRNADGRVIRLHGTLQDVTERRQAEVALQDLHARRFECLFQQSMGGVHRIDDGGEPRAGVDHALSPRRQATGLGCLEPGDGDGHRLSH